MDALEEKMRAMRLKNEELLRKRSVRRDVRTRYPHLTALSCRKPRRTRRHSPRWRAPRQSRLLSTERPKRPGLRAQRRYARYHCCVSLKS